MTVLKASIIDLTKKKEQQILDDMAMTSSERIDKMFLLMELCADIKPSKTLFDSSEIEMPHIVLRYHGCPVQK